MNGRDDTDTGLTLIRKHFGERMREYRESADRTRDDVEAMGICSISKLWRIESGRTAVRSDDVNELTTYYEVPSDVRTVLVQMARGTREPGWLEAFGPSVPESLRIYTGLEASASRILAYEPELIHGILQTPEYMRVVISSADWLTTREVEQAVELRMQRQSKFLSGRAPGRLRCVLGPGAFRLVVGSPGVMSAQLDHLRVMVDRDLIDLRILPWESGPHPWMHGPFAVMDFDHPEYPSCVYVETRVGSKYMGQQKTLAEYSKIFVELYNRAVPIKEYRNE